MKILIVEDTESSRILLELTLAAEGYEVMSGENGLEALQLAQTTLPDLIISDIMMPEMDGFEFCRKVKADPALKNIPFIFYTATYTEHKDEELALALGADRFVIKPQEISVFMEIIRETLTQFKTEQISTSHEPQKKYPELDQMYIHSIGRKLDKKVFELEREREALSKSEEKYRHLVEAVQNYYFFYTKNLEGIYTYISPSIESILGYTPEEFLVHYSRYLTKNPHNHEATQQFELNRKGEEQAAFEIEIYHKSGSTSWLEIKEFPIFDQHGKITHIEGIAHDISKRKQADKIMHRSQKMNALGKLTGGIAHDYNNMLGVIIGYAELLEESLTEQPKLNKFAHEIHHAAERGSKLSRKLLAFTQHKSTNAQSTNINTLLHEQKNLLEKSLTARIKLTLNLEADLWNTYLDSSDFEDATLNLTLNALYAMESSGQLTIQTTNQKINGIDAKQLNLIPGDYVLLSFADTGCGIEKTIEDKIFDPFYTTKGSKGTGLGLSQVYGFVERSKGVIKVYSELGHGSRFNLYFPRYIGSESKNLKPTNQPKPDYRGTETILVVDDEPALLDLTTEILCSQGYKVHCAQSGKEALEILKNQSIDLLLSDVIMPNMNGYELIAIVEKKYPRLKILLASGFSEISDEFMINNSIQQNLLQKPYNSQTLLKKIRSLLD